MSYYDSKSENCAKKMKGSVIFHIQMFRIVPQFTSISIQEMAYFQDLYWVAL